MSNNLNTLVLAELYTADKYIERLCHAYRGGTVEFPFCLGEDYIEDLYDEIRKKIFIVGKEDFGRDSDISIGKILDVTGHVSKVCKAMVGLDFDTVGSAFKIANIVNVMYRYGYCFHLYAYKTHMRPIPVPSPPLAEIVKTDYKESAIPLLGLMPDKLENAFRCGRGRSLYEFQEQRERRYRDMLGEGKRLVMEGAWDEAEALLLKIQGIKETGEILGLLARIKFQKGQKEEAKEYCTMSIHKDPDYGPSYSELGCYWEAEGNYTEALKWFALAKQCVRYLQREEAYIKCGYIYKKQKKYFLALEQFRIALEMVPFNNKLRKDAEELEGLLSSTMNSSVVVEKITNYSHGY